MERSPGRPRSRQRGHRRAAADDLRARAGHVDQGDHQRIEVERTTERPRSRRAGGVLSMPLPKSAIDAIDVAIAITKAAHPNAPREEIAARALAKLGPEVQEALVRDLIEKTVADLIVDAEAHDTPQDRERALFHYQLNENERRRPSAQKPKTPKAG